MNEHRLSQLELDPASVAPASSSMSARTARRAASRWPLGSSRSSYTAWASLAMAPPCQANQAGSMETGRKGLKISRRSWATDHRGMARSAKATAEATPTQRSTASRQISAAPMGVRRELAKVALSSARVSRNPITEG